MTNQTQKRVEANIEVEYKYHAGDLTKEAFHSRIEGFLGEIFEPFYVVSCDDYYTNDILAGHSFLRYRKGGGLTELTIKIKKEEDNNYVRKEINVNVDGNDDSSIVEFIKLSGYQKLFSVFKEAWIWHIEEDGVDISFYTLPDDRNFIELEAECHTSEEGIKMIDKWEKILKLGSLEKEDRSLYEIISGEKLEARQ